MLGIFCRGNLSRGFYGGSVKSIIISVRDECKNDKFSHYDYDISQHSNFLACLILQKLLKRSKYTVLPMLEWRFFAPAKNSHDALRTYNAHAYIGCVNKPYRI